MKESFIIMRNEPTKIHHKQPNKSKKYVLELKKNCGFCSVIGYITTGGPTKMNIGRLIKGDDLIILLKDKCSIRPIKNDEIGNIYRSIINWPKLKHLRCQQLLCSTNPCPNKRPDIDNLIVKVTFYDNIGNAIISFCNIMVELKLIISYIYNKKDNQTNHFFSKIHEECCGESFYSYERKNIQSLSEVF